MAITRSSGSSLSNISSFPRRTKALKFSYGKHWGRSLDHAVFRNLRGGISEEEGPSVVGGWVEVGMVSVRAFFKGGSIMVSSIWISGGVY